MKIDTTPGWNLKGYEYKARLHSGKLGCDEYTAYYGETKAQALNKLVMALAEKANVFTTNTGYGWYATDANYDGAIDSHDPMGTGDTECEAIIDYLDIEIIGESYCKVGMPTANDLAVFGCLVIVMFGLCVMGMLGGAN